MDLKKTCSKCSLTKPISEFYTDNSKKDGVQLWCKSCDKRMKERRVTNKQTKSYKRSLVEAIMRDIRPTDY